MVAISIACKIGEGNLAQELQNIENADDNIEIGCYPWFKSGVIGTNIVVRSLNKDSCQKAASKVKNFIKTFGETPEIIE